MIGFVSIRINLCALAATPQAPPAFTLNSKESQNDMPNIKNAVWPHNRRGKNFIVIGFTLSN